ncbi:MAG: DNA repair protein RecO [Candidatus Aegiribacteria sp.]|nr:DNA repair protein RecO [Candidatus Aegiribacteria sp.]
MSSERETIRITTPSFVLRRVRWSESSLILTLYSLDFGRISAIVKGALRAKSPFSGRIELLSMVDLSLSRREGRELDTATEATVINHYDSIRSDPDAFVHSCLFIEWLLHSITGSEPSHPMFHLIREVLDNFAAGAPFWPVLCSGIEKSLRLSGFAMEIDRCTRCGGDPRGSSLWDASSGGIVCENCGSGNSERIPPGLIAFLRKSRSGRLDEVRNLKLWRGGYRQCLDLMRRFAEVHMETRIKLKSLSVLEALENDR